MKRLLLFIAVAVVCAESSLFAATITLSNKDPRNNNPDLIDRGWGARLRNFGVIGDCCEIYVGSGDLSDPDNRKEADMLWNNRINAQNSFTLVYSPHHRRV